jgi:hypothetical protein
MVALLVLHVRTMHDVSVPSGGLGSELPANHSSQVLHRELHTELQSVPDPIGPGRQVHEAVVPQLVQGRSGRETNPARRFSCTAKHAHTSTSASQRSQEAVCVCVTVCDGEVAEEGKDSAQSEQTCSMWHVPYIASQSRDPHRSECSRCNQS